LTEAISEDRGYLVDSGTSPSLLTILPHDNEVIRPLVDVDDMVKKLVEIQSDYPKALAKAEKAYEWVTKELAWGANGPVVDRWIKIFDKMYADFVKESVMGEEEKVEGPVITTIESEQF